MRARVVGVAEGSAATVGEGEVFAAGCAKQFGATTQQHTPAMTREKARDISGSIYRAAALRAMSRR